MKNKIMQWIKKRRYKKFINKYNKDPFTFCEDYFGIRLYDYQKKMLNNIYKTKVNTEYFDANEMNELIRNSRNQM